MLQAHINPEAEAKVILPLWVNSRDLEFGEQLVYYKKAEVADEKKRKALEVVDAIGEWAKQKTELRTKKKSHHATGEVQTKSHHKS